jgi:hypothetical protein
MKIGFLIASEDALINKSDDTLSIINIIDVIEAGSLPILLNKLAISMGLEGNAGIYNVEIKINSPVKEIFNKNIDITILDGRQKTQHVLYLGGFGIDNEGIYEIEASHNGDVVKTFFNVKKA